MRNLSEGTLRQLEAVAAESGCRLLEVESSGSGASAVLRLVLERIDGSPVTIEECEAVSRDASPILDVADEIAHRYTLEVSSAGLDRKLYSAEDAARFVGKRVRVQTQTPVMPSIAEASKARTLPSRNLNGVLSAVDGDALTIVDEENRKTYNVRFADIRLARLDFEWPGRGRSALRK
jgi:ribosome maturation factor RimP